MAETGKKVTSSKAKNKKNSTARVRAYSKDAAKKGRTGRGDEQIKARVKKRSKLFQFMPLILALAAIVVGAFVYTNIFCNFGNTLKGGAEPTHMLGVVGFYVSEALFGIFGWTALLLPIALFALAIFWKKLYDDGKLVSKCVLGGLIIVFAASLTHVFVEGFAEGDFTYNFMKFYADGAALSDSGVIGAYVGGLFYALLNWGAAFLLGILIAILSMYFVGFQLHTYISRIGEPSGRSKGDKEKEKRRREKEKEAERRRKEKEKEERRSKRDYEEDYEDDYYEDDENDVDEVDDDIEDDIDDYDRRAKKSPRDIKSKNGKGNAERRDEPKLIPPEEDEPVDEPEDEPEQKRIEAFNKKNPKVKKDSPKIIIQGAQDFEEDGESDSEGEEDYEEDVIDTEGLLINSRTGEVIEDEPEEPALVIDDELKGELESEEDIPEDEEKYEVEYVFPPVDMLKKGSLQTGTSPEEIEENKEILREVLENFKIKVKDISCSCGPTITRYEIKPDAGVRVRAIANLVDDISLALAKSGVRIEAPIPGKAAVGVEVPNDSRSTVLLRSLIETADFQNHKSKIASCLGADVSGRPVVFDIEKMPHLLVAGTTGSGKSVCINTIILSILYRAKPNEVKLILVDPKKVEFNVYRDIPHLACRIVSDPKKAAGALNSAVNEMEKRFELIEEVGVRNITAYNEITKNDPDKPYMPRMVIIIDELADLMMTAPDEVETAICRIAQKARAAGIHLILGTQRPSVDVITGLIKANIPSRIAFTVTSAIDSRTIIDIGGAEKLTGMGDMLYSPVGASKPLRVQGAFVSDGEVERVVDFIKENNAPVAYNYEFERSIDEEAARCGNPPAGKKSSGDEGGSSGDEDPKLYEAVELAIEAGKISTSLLQRKLEIGYGRAAKIIDRMEELGYVGPPDGNKPRKILVTAQDLAEKKINDNDDGGIFD